jgi:hypothetical protein
MEEFQNVGKKTCPLVFAAFNYLTRYSSGRIMKATAFSDEKLPPLQYLCG